MLASLAGNAWVQNALFVLAGLIVFAVFWYLARTVRDLVGRWLVQHHVGGDAVVLGRRVVYVTLLIVGILTALGFAFQSGNVAIFGVIVATIVASLGIQDVLKNYVSGYYVLLERHLRVGETIALESGQGGVIEDIRLRVTLLRAKDGSQVVVPNATLFGSTVVIKPPGASRKGAEHDPAEGVETV